MPHNTSYSLPKDSKAWQQAVDSIASLLPDNTNLQDFDALQSLPVFALIVVLPTKVSTLDIHQYVQSWVDEQPSWHLVTVAEDTDASFVNITVSDTEPTAANAQRLPFTQAQVFRYLLVPVTDTLMHPGKKTAAAHIIDDQLTTRLRHDLTEAYNDSHQASSAERLDIVDCHILSVGHMLRTTSLPALIWIPP